MKPFYLFPVSYIKAGTSGSNKAASIKEKNTLSKSSRLFE